MPLDATDITATVAVANSDFRFMYVCIYVCIYAYYTHIHTYIHIIFSHDRNRSTHKHSPSNLHVAHNTSTDAEYVSSIFIGNEQIGGSFLQFDGADRSCSKFSTLLDDLAVPSGVQVRSE